MCYCCKRYYCARARVCIFLYDDDDFHVDYWLSVLLLRDEGDDGDGPGAPPSIVVCLRVDDDDSMLLIEVFPRVAFHSVPVSKL